MNETNKFVDSCGDSIQVTDGNGFMQIWTSHREVILTPDQAIEFAKQLTELAQEVKGNESA